MKSRCGKSLNLKTKAMIKQYKYNWKTAKKKKNQPYQLLKHQYQKSLVVVI